VIVAIDPGIQGAAAALDSRGSFIDVIDLPTIEVHMCTGKVRKEIDIPAFWQWLRSVQPKRIIIENVHSFPREGSVGAFRFGVAFGSLHTMAQLHSIYGTKPELVEPAVWKRYFELLHEEKDESRQLAIALFPQMAFTHLTRKKDEHRAEAMLMAWWADRPPVGRNWGASRVAV
jgi:hypothetical protein